MDEIAKRQVTEERELQLEKQKYINHIWESYLDTDLVQLAKKEMLVLPLDILIYLFCRLDNNQRH